MKDNIEVRTTVFLPGDYRNPAGRRLELNYAMPMFEFEEVAPIDPKGCGIEDFARIQQRDERRRRFVDMVSAQLAHSFIKAFYEAVK